MNPRITADVNELLARMRHARSAVRESPLFNNTMLVEAKDVETLHAVLMMLDFSESVLRREP